MLTFVEFLMAATLQKTSFNHLQRDLPIGRSFLLRFAPDCRIFQSKVLQIGVTLLLGSVIVLFYQTVAEASTIAIPTSPPLSSSNSNSDLDRGSGARTSAHLLQRRQGLPRRRQGAGSR
jgi:hypothetical protein